MKDPYTLILECRYTKTEAKKKLTIMRKARKELKEHLEFVEQDIKKFEKVLKC